MFFTFSCSGWNIHLLLHRTALVCHGPLIINCSGWSGRNSLPGCWQTPLVSPCPTHRQASHSTLFCGAERHSQPLCRKQRESSQEAVEGVSVGNTSADTRVENRSHRAPHVPGFLPCVIQEGSTDGLVTGDHPLRPGFGSLRPQRPLLWPGPRNAVLRGLQFHRERWEGEEEPCRGARR